MEATRDLCNELHSFRDGCSSARVLDGLERFLDIEHHTLKSKPLNLIRKLKVRRRLRKELIKGELIQ
jgi:hypothetical protein